MTYGLLGVGFIFLILFLLYKLIRFAIRLTSKGFNAAKNVVGKPRYQNYDHFPEEAFPSYEISQNEFFKIANKTAYRHPRVENVEISGNTVFIEFSSQTGLSRSHARLIFSLEGASVGKYSIKTDNPDSSVPTHIADRIQATIRTSVGID